MISSNCKFHEIQLIFSWSFNFLCALSVDEMFQKHIEHIFFLYVKRALSKMNFLVFEVERPLVCLVVKTDAKVAKIRKFVPQIFSSRIRYRCS